MASTLAIFWAIAMLFAISSIDAYRELPEELREAFLSIRDGCVTESGLTDPSLIEKTLTGHFEDDRNLACYSKCIYETFGVMDKAGNLNWDKMAKVLPPSLRSESIPMIEKCRETEITGDDACMIGMELTKCFYNANPDLYFVV